MGLLSRSRKSSSADGHAIYNNTSASSSAAGSTTTVDSLSARIVKTLTWGSSRPRSSDGNSNNSPTTTKFRAPPTSSAAPPRSSKGKKKQPRKVRHPSERELTEANLRHYEMLSGFKMEFGRTRSRTSLDSDVSPMGSRLGSFDYGSDGFVHGSRFQRR